MAITKETVLHTAHLARLAINPEDVADYSAKLSSILEWVEQLQNTNTDGIEPMAHPFDLAQRLREDKIVEPNQRQEFQAIAPAVEAGLYLVPKVIE